MSQFGPLILAGLGQGADVVDRANRLAMLLQGQQFNQQQIQEQQRRADAEEAASRQFWRSNLASLAGPQAGPGSLAQPTGPMGPGTSVPTGPEPMQPFGGMLDNPNVGSQDLRHAYDFGTRLARDQAEQAQKRQQQATFNAQLEKYADRVAQDFPDEAAAGLAEGKATGRWPSNWKKPIGVVEPGVYEQMLSQDPEERAAGYASFNRTTGKNAIPAQIRPQGPKLPSPESVEAVRSMYGDDTAEVYAREGKIIRPKGGEVPVDPEERGAKFGEIVDGYGGAQAFNPGGLVALKDKFVRGGTLTEGDWKRALVAKEAAHKGDLTAAKVEYEDFSDKLRVAHADLRAAKNDKKLRPELEKRVQQLETLKARALGKYIDTLKAADAIESRAPIEAPAVPAAASPAAANGPATPDEIQAARAAGAKTPEEAVEFIKKRRQGQ